MAYSKGQIITMKLDGTNREYRILTINGNIAEVVCMSTVGNSKFGSNNTYAGSALDTYLNSTWYNRLTAAAKAAIVSKTFNQDSWYWGTNGSPVYSGHYGTNVPGTTSYSISKGSATYGEQITRNVYALSVQDVIDYITNTDVGDGKLENYNFWKMFWNTTTKPSIWEEPWLRSAIASGTSLAWNVDYYYGYVYRNGAGGERAVRPALTIDLSKFFKLGYSITYHANDGIPTPQNLTNQTKLPTLPIVSKTNYNFVGWYYDSTFTQEAHAGDTLSANVDLYAKFIRSHITLDLTTLSGWGNVANGQHSIQVVAKADGYKDSEKSTAVSFTKGSSFTQVPVTLTNPYSNGISFNASNAPFGRISNMDKTKIYSLNYINRKFDYLSYNGTQWSLDIETGLNISIKSQTETSVDLYMGISGGVTGSLHSIIALEGTTRASVSDFTGHTGTETLPEYICLIEGTLVTLADGSTKPIEDITYDDELLVWNFYDGKFDKAKPCWVTKPQIAHEYNLCKFSNGVEIGFVGQGGDIGYHRIYNDELKSFTHTGVKETPIGTHTFAQDGSKPTLIEQHIVKKQVRYYNVGTEKHINIFTNGILTSSRISNKYAIKDMKYVGERLISEQEEQEYIRKTLKRC